MKTDNNVPAELGRRIKDRRKKLGLTQSQLCGDYMTRNMLSRIETGNASPSLDTLMYISQKLKMPPAFFLCRDAKEEAEYTKTVRIKDARRALSTGQYKKCSDICQDLPSDDDEVSLMIANANISCAIVHFDKGELQEANSHLEKASTALHQTVYMYSALQSQIKLLRALSAALSKGTPVAAENIPDTPPAFFTRDRYLYILSLGTEAELWAEAAFSEESAYLKHLKARKHMSIGEWEKAIELLRDACDNAPDCYAEYFTLVDLESAYRAAEDFKSAYSLAQKRMELKEKYSK